MDELKRIFESLISEYEKRIHKYVEITRKQKSDESISKIAFEISDIFKLAQMTLPSDASNPYGFEAFEKKYHQIRSESFKDPDGQTPNDFSED